MIACWLLTGFATVTIAGQFGTFPIDPAVNEAEQVLQLEVKRLRAVYPLTDAQIRHLEVAAKGAAELHIRHLDEIFPPDDELPAWADGISSFYCRQAGEVFLGEDAIDQCLLHHPLWQHAVKKVIPPTKDEEELKRKIFHRRHAVETALLAIDNRLHLTDEQRKKLRPLVQGIADEMLQDVNCSKANWMLIPLVAGLDMLPDKKLAEFLHPVQIELWKESGSIRTMLSGLEFNIPSARKGQGGFPAGGGGFF